MLIDFVYFLGKQHEYHNDITCFNKHKFKREITWKDIWANLKWRSAVAPSSGVAR